MLADWAGLGNWPRGLAKGEKALWGMKEVVKIRTNHGRGCCSGLPQTSERNLEDTTAWVEATLPLCAHCWLSFPEKLGRGLGELALEQLSGLEQVIADQWLIHF